jgi:hypothetical protein
MQFVNKAHALHFDEEDENLCEVRIYPKRTICGQILLANLFMQGFAVFCGLGIHKVMLYDNMVKA